jgi:antitoxin component of MazEF toxin-antitoxin module
MDFELKNPPSVEKRKLVKSGASVVITLPKNWLEENKLDAGSEVIVVANGDIQILKSNKENVERLNEKISQIRNQLGNNPTGQEATASSDHGRTGSSDEKI